MPNLNNDEDRKLWAAIEDFPFDEYKNLSTLRVELFNAILKRIGYCKECNFFSSANNTCSLLKIRTGLFDRCGDFEKVEEEEGEPFEIMTEEFTAQQRLMDEATRISKYTHWSKNSKSPRKQGETEEHGGEV